MSEMYRFLAAIFATLIAGINGKPVEQPTALASEDYPRYAFHYAVSDPYSKDNKAQWEERDGDIVKGSYSLREPDGSLRVVEYSASDGVGFNAVVKNVGPNIHPIKISQTINHQVPLVPLVPPVPPVPVVQPIITPQTYGLGPTPISLGVPKTTLYGESSLPWDPLTGSYGGWVPLPPGPHAYIISKKVVDGHLQKVVVGPISLLGKKIIVRTKKN